MILAVCGSARAKQMALARKTAILIAGIEPDRPC